MLTPGEYVIKKSAVDRVGVGALSAINSGRYARGGLVQYRQDGGSAGQAAIDSTKKFLMDTYGWSEKEYQEKMEAEKKNKGFGPSGIDQNSPLPDDGFKDIILNNRKEGAAEAEAKRKETQKRIEFEQTSEGKYVRGAIEAYGNTEDEKQSYLKGRGLLSFQTEADKKRIEEQRDTPSIASRFPKGDPTKSAEYQSMQIQQKEREAKEAKLAALEAERKRKEDIEAAEGMKMEKQRAAEAGPTKFGGVEEAQAWLKKQRDFDRGVEARVAEMSKPKFGAPAVGPADPLIDYAAAEADKALGLDQSNINLGGDRLVDWYNSLTGQGGMGGRARSPELVNSLDKLTKQLQAAAGTAGTATRDAQGRAFGGLVQYRAGGGSIFQPRGTDTVPAMLTPGEFVIKKSSVDKIGKGNLAALNNGYANGGLVQYRAVGGGIGAGNTIESKGMMSSDQVKDSFVNAVGQIGVGRMLQIFNTDGGISDDLRQKIFRLIKGGKLNIKDLTAPDVWASRIGRLKNYAEENDFIEGAMNGRLKVRGPEFGWLPGVGSTNAQRFKWRSGLRDYRNSMGVITQGISDIFGKQGTAVDGYGKGRVKASGRIFEEGLGWDMGRYGSLPFGTSRIFDTANKVLASVNPGRPFTSDTRAALLRLLANQRPPIDLSTTQIIGGGKVTRNMNNAIGDFEQDPNPRQGRLMPREFQNMLDVLQQQGVIRFAQGGNVPGTDTVPAMLTPGEFVMNKAAVAQHGVGYMKSLNRGRIPGFNRGGVVGHGGVQYKQNGGGVGGGGGVISIDPTRLQNVLTVFGTEFSNTLDGIVKPFDQMGRSLLAVANSLQNMTWVHTFKGELGLSVNISNKDAIIAAVSEGLAPNIEQLIINTVDTKLSDQRFGQ
jgi:hypothetical protein